MNIFSAIAAKIREVFRKMIPYQTIQQAERIETPLSTDMVNALNQWYQLYLNKASWLSEDVKSLNLPAFISSEIARSVVIEMKWNITGKGLSEDGEEIMNPRAEYLKAEFEKLVRVIRLKLEQGCAAGGMLIKPYPNVEDGHIYFDYAMNWGLYPLAFDDDGNLSDVIIPDVFQEGRTTYTRLERHTVTREGVRITQRAFKSDNKDSLGKEIELTDVDRWSALQKEALIRNPGGPLFGWYKVAAANNVEVDCPMGASVFSKAIDVIKQADIQYSRILWEYEGSELAIDVDPYVLRPKPGSDGVMEPPKLNKRLFRAVDADKGDRDLYQVFSPNIRDESLMNGLNQLLIRIEDLSGLSRGTLSDANQEARTATEIKIIKQRTYTTVSDNQAALETCLRDVIRVMDAYATIYGLAPEGDYDVSFEWDDSILTDTDLQTQERLMLLNAGIISKAEFREWYFGETKAQAKAGITSVTEEQVNTAKALNAALPGPDVNPEMPDEPPRDEEAAQPPKAPETPRVKNPTAPDIPQPAQPKKG